MTTITIERRHLKASLVCMAKADVRDYLNGAMLETGAGEHGNMVIIVATDGHRLSVSLAAGTDATESKQVIIPRALIEQVCKHKVDKQACDVVAITCETTLGEHGDEVHIGMKMPDGTNYVGKALVGRFPDWRRVSRAKRGNGVGVTVDPRFYGGISDFFSALSGRFGKPETINAGLAVDYHCEPDSMGAVAVATKANEAAYMLIMPMRTPDEDKDAGMAHVASLLAMPAAVNTREHDLRVWEARRAAGA